MIKKLFNQYITTEHFVSYALHFSYKGVKLSPDQLIVVTDLVTHESFFSEEKFSSQ